MNRKRTLSLFLVLCMVLSLFPILPLTVSAATVSLSDASNAITELKVGNTSISSFAGGTGTSSDPYTVAADAESYDNVAISLKTNNKTGATLNYGVSNSNTDAQSDFSKNINNTSGSFTLNKVEGLSTTSNVLWLKFKVDNSTPEIYFAITIKSSKTPTPGIKEESYYASNGFDQQYKPIYNKKATVFLNNNKDYSQYKSLSGVLYSGPDFSTIDENAKVTDIRNNQAIDIEFTEPINQIKEYKIVLTGVTDSGTDLVSEKSNTFKIIPTTPTPETGNQEIAVSKGSKDLVINLLNADDYSSGEYGADVYTQELNGTKLATVTGSYSDGKLTLTKSDGWTKDEQYYVSMIYKTGNFGPSERGYFKVRIISSNAELSSIKGNGIPAEIDSSNPGTGTQEDPYQYTLQVDETASNVSFEIKTSGKNSKVEFQSGEIWSESNSVSVSNSPILIRVTAEDGKTTAFYQVKMNVLEFSLATLETEGHIEVTDATVKEAVEKAVLETKFSTENDTTIKAIDDALIGAADKIIEEYPIGTSKDEAGSVWNKLDAAGVNVANAESIHIYSSAYLDISVASDGYKAGDKTYKLDITPKFRLIASTSTDKKGINLEEKDQASKNAIFLTDPQDIKLENVDVFVTLPNGFADTAGTYAFVKHGNESVWKVFELTIEGDKNSYFTMTVPSFSLFTITTEVQGKAIIDSLVYNTVQEAVDAVQNGQTIKLTSAASKTDIQNLKIPSSGTKLFDFNFSELYPSVIFEDFTFADATINGTKYTINKENPNKTIVHIEVVEGTQGSGSTDNPANPGGSGGSSGGTGGSGGSTSGGTSGSNGNTSSSDATLKPNVVPNSNGEVVSQIQPQAITDGVKDSQKNKKDNVVVAPQVNGTASKVRVTLPKTSAAEVGNAGLGLTLDTDIGDITIPSASLKELNKMIGSRVELSITAGENGTSNIEVKVGSSVVDRLNNGMFVSLPAKSGDVLVLVGSDGKETVVKKSVVDEGVVRALLDGSCTVKTIDNSKSFTDVTNSQWFSGAVAFASSHELFQGITTSEFAPDAPMSRAMLATVLYRLEDASASGSSEAFQDVSSDSWFADSIAWANSNGIVQGYPDGTFGPDISITREQLATMLYRYAKLVGLNTASTGNLANYADQGKVSSYATEAMQWAVGNGLVQGMADGTLNPGGNASRAQVAQIAQRLIELMVH